jgi:outer membrane protein with beta-barrel domain
MIKNFAIALSAAAAVLLLGAAPAHAEAASTAGKGSIAGLLGYGFKDGTNLGLGVRGGYTLPMNLYLGGTFVYHLGKSESTGFGDVKANIYYFGVEGGYDIAAGPVVVRPYLGLGGATLKATSPGFNLGGISVPSASNSETRFALWPGATVLYPLGSAFIGADARFLIVEDSNAFSLFATGGVQF